tara:strand:+ start:229 stop:864 length:636 start_codon:yes stop_codon:yes gene_type:complete
MYATNDYTKSFALTFRPSGGVKHIHEIRMEAWLFKHAEQYEIFEETKEDDPATLHWHGRVLLNKEMRWDKLKVSLINWLRLELAEKKVLQQGIKHLYDEWDYAGKDGHAIFKNITDEDKWVYADPGKKVKKKVNAQIEYYYALIIGDIRNTSDVTEFEIMNCIMPHWVNGRVEMPKTESARKELVKSLRLFIEFRALFPNEESGHTASDDE